MRAAGVPSVEFAGGAVRRPGKTGHQLADLEPVWQYMAPGGPREIYTAWMWGALLAASMAAWLHQLTTATRGETLLDGHGTRGGKAMIETLRRRLIAVPARLVRHAGQLTLRLPPGHGLLAEVLARLRALPAMP